MTDHAESPDDLPDEMAEYLPTFLDETEEQLDDLVETMLALEGDCTKKEDLNEAFRLIHSIKGSAGMMGFDNITVLTHHLENRFERFRSGTEMLDEGTMNLVLRSIDFLRQCSDRLRAGERLGSPSELLDELKRLEELAETRAPAEPKRVTEDSQSKDDVAVTLPSTAMSQGQDVSDASWRVVVRFRADLQLADLKAQLIVARLAGLGDVKSTSPDLDHLSEHESIDAFEIQLESRSDLKSLRAAVDVEGVHAIEFLELSPNAGNETATDAVDLEMATRLEPGDGASPPPRVDHASEPELSGSDAEPDANDVIADSVPPTPANSPQDGSAVPALLATESAEMAADGKAATKIAETMRVDIDRLDKLMNLTGELVVNREHFVQISGQISPALRKASTLNRIRDFSDGLRSMIESLERDGDDFDDRSARILQLKEGLELMDEQSAMWENSRHCIGQIGDAIDQLSRVSHSLQRGVLDTRMVPVGPLFNRFKRVVRDLSKGRGKSVNLQIRGEKTELDKRMIDDLGDPLVHLVRNSIDHGLERGDVRVGRGKTEVGTICLEASHSGNNVFIRVRDDGGGIDVERVKDKLVEGQILTRAAVDELTEAQALDYIWHPGFSTAQEVTDVSGRGVGMDVVKTRVNSLNGTIEVDSQQHRGTVFTLRLPLTLAIIDCLLVRLRGVVFSMPMDDVREIVSIRPRDIVTVQGKQNFEVRDEFIPLVNINDLFHWHGIDYGANGSNRASHVPSSQGNEQVVIFHVAGRTMGLRVDELLGNQDIVIKSLSDNFISIRGLSGASVLGDGSVCLMLDVGTLVDMAFRASRPNELRETVN